MNSRPATRTRDATPAALAALAALAMALSLAFAGEAAAAESAGSTGDFKPKIARFEATFSGVVHTSWSQDRKQEGCSRAITGSGAQRIVWETPAMTGHPPTRTEPLVAVKYPRSKEVYLYRRFDPDRIEKARPAEYVIEVAITRQGSQTFGPPPPPSCPTFDGGNGEEPTPDCGDRSHVSRIAVTATSPRHLRWDEDESQVETIDYFLGSSRGYRNCPFFRPYSPYPELFSKSKQRGWRPKDLGKGEDLTDLKRRQQGQDIVVTSDPVPGGVSTTTETTLRLTLTPR